jgi:pseudouridine-5'-phosphate glycosidase
MAIKKTVVKKSLPKAQNGKSVGTGSYIISNNGRIGRTNGLYGSYESIDTTGYSKGKKEFILKNSLSGYKPTSTKISRKEVPSKIAKLKKGATKVVDNRIKNKK